MTNALLATLVWSLLAAHLAFGYAVSRRMTALPLVPALNLLLGGVLLVYWIPRWLRFLGRGTGWYFPDQWFPLYGAVVCVLALLSLSGRMSSTVPGWIVFGAHTLAMIAAAVFVSTFTMNRLM